MLTVKYHGTSGLPLWIDAAPTLDIPQWLTLTARGMVLDGTDSVVILARSGVFLPQNAFGVRKLSLADGSPAWTGLAGGTAFVGEPYDGFSALLAHDVAATPDGTVWVASSENEFYFEMDHAWRVHGFDAATGALTSRIDYADPLDGPDLARSLATAPDGSLRVAGSGASEFGPRMLLARIEPGNTDSLLVDLSASEGTMQPGFASHQHAYRLELPAATHSVSFTATTSGIQGVLQIDAADASSGSLRPRSHSPTGAIRSR